MPLLAPPDTEKKEVIGQAHQEGEGRQPIKADGHQQGHQQPCGIGLDIQPLAEFGLPMLPAGHKTVQQIG